MRFLLSWHAEDQVLRNLQRHSRIGIERVWQDLKQALAQTLGIYELDANRQRCAFKSREKGKHHAR